MHKKKLYYQRQPTSGSEKEKTGNHRTRLQLPSFEGKDPKDMSEEEKLQWKHKVMKDCEKQDDKIQGVLDVLQSQREAINSIIESANAMQFEYKDAVDRIGYRAKD